MEKSKDAIIKVTTDDGKVLTIVSKRGEKGETGETGRDGENGKDGINGLDGKDGVDGLPGADGKDGANGTDGLDGKDGAQGAKGDKGDAGSPDTPEQVKEKLLKLGIEYDEIQNTPDINKIITIVNAGIKQASKTVSLTELDDVNLSGLTQTNGKYNLGSGGGGGGTVETIVPGSKILVDATDPANPIVSVDTLTLNDISDVTASSAEVNILTGTVVTSTELNFLEGAASNIQSQINTKSSKSFAIAMAVAL